MAVAKLMKKFPIDIVKLKVKASSEYHSLFRCCEQRIEYSILNKIY